MQILPCRYYRKCIENSIENLGVIKEFFLFFLQSITKKIFKLYAKSKPGRVAEIILMSSLSGFSSGWLEKIVYWINLFFIIIIN